MFFIWMMNNCEYDYETFNQHHKPISDYSREEYLEEYDYYERSDMYTNGYTGICGDFAKMSMELCWTQGIPCVMMDGENEIGGHAWNAFYADGEWHWADPTTTSTSLAKFDMDDDAIFVQDWKLVCCQITSDWAEPWILQALEYGLIDHKFSKDITTKTPATIWMYFDEPCTRQGFAQLAVNLLETYYNKDIDTIMEEKGVTPGTFTDTDNPDVLAANALGIVTGWNGEYNPDGNIKRQEAAAILYRTAKVMGYDAPGADLSVFEDLSSISSYAHESVAFCKATGIMGGMTTTTFDPLGEYTAEQCLVTIVRLYEAATAQN